MIGLYLYVFLVGLYTVFPRYIELASINAVNLIAISIFCMTFLFNPKLVYKRTGAVFSLMPLWISMLYVVFAYMFHENYIDAAMTLCNSLLICISLCLTVNNERRFKLIIKAVLRFAFIICICGLFECIMQKNLLFAFRSDPYIEIRNGIFRISTTFDHPIVYANYLGFILTLTFYMICKENNRKQRNYLILLYILAALNLYLSGSRSAIIVIFLAQLFLFYFLEQRSVTVARLFKFCIFPVLGCAALISLLLSDSSQLGIYGAILFELIKGGVTGVTAVGDRFMLWTWVWEATKNRAVWGNGITAVFSFQRSYYYIKNSIEVEYLYIFFKMGFVGLIVSVVGLISMLKYSIMNRNKAIKKRDDFNFFISVMLVAYYIILFAVTRQSELRAFYVIFSLCICYNKFTSARGVRNK